MKQSGNFRAPLRSMIHHGQASVKFFGCCAMLVALSGCSTLANLFDDDQPGAIESKSEQQSGNSQSSAFQHILYDRSQVAIRTSQSAAQSSSQFSNSLLDSTYRVVAKECEGSISADGLYYLDHWISRRGLNPAAVDASADYIVVVGSSNGSSNSSSHQLTDTNANSSDNKKATTDFCDRDYKEILTPDETSLTSIKPSSTQPSLIQNITMPDGQYSAQIFILTKNESGHSVSFAADFTGKPSNAETSFPEIFALKTLASAWLTAPSHKPSNRTFGIAFDVLPNKKGQYYPVIMRILAGSRADKAGLRPGDRVISANQQSMMNVSTEAVKQWAMQLPTTQGVWRIVRQGNEQSIALEQDNANVMNKTMQVGRYMDRQQGKAP